MKNFKAPIRTCIGCRCKYPQNTLIRFVCRTGEALEMEELQKLPGRGAYVCRSKSCIENAFKVPKRINTLLRVRLSESVITEFKQALLEKEIFADEENETASS
jgi:predicted RNA-binding protein YlxR (DUF448 family)